MIRVFFESNGYCEQVATFQSEDMYVSMLPYLVKLANVKGFDKVTETMEEDWVSTAEHYLSGSDVESQVYAIAKHENQEDLIDYVSGVMVWQPLEGMFRCSDFLEAISYKG
jgi:hypothetical protein